MSFHKHFSFSLENYDYFILSTEKKLLILSILPFKKQLKKYIKLNPI